MRINRINLSSYFSILHVTLYFVALCVASCQKEKPFLFFSEGDRVEMSLYDTLTLHLDYTPTDAALTDVRWGWVDKTDNEAAVFLSDATLWGRSIGTSEIVAEGRVNGDLVYATCRVEVKVFAMTSLQLDSTECRILQGEDLQLKVSYEPSNTTYPYLSWRTSDARIATVDSKGNVKAISPGACVISVVNELEGLADSCKVTVLPIEIASLSCLAEKTLEQGEYFTLFATCQPENATRSLLRWQSSDETVAQVDEMTGEVVGVGVGECMITISNTYNSVTASCRLRVLPASVKSIRLSKSSLEIAEGETAELSYSVLPSYAANKDVVWESSDESIAAVSENGIVRAISAGEATIKVTALDGSGCSAECLVKILTLQQYVEKYIEEYIKIEVGFTGITINGVVLPGSFWTFALTNLGDEKVLLKEAKGYGGVSNSIRINQYIAPNETYKKSLNTPNIEWVFEMYGIECVKRN